MTPGGPLQQPEDMTELECLRELVAHARHVRDVLARYEPLLSAVKPNGKVNYVRAAGLRRAMRAPEQPSDLGGTVSAGTDEQQQTEQPGDVDARLGALEERQQRQEGLLQQILDRLPGKSAPGSTPGDSGAGAGNIGELIRRGVAELEERKQREQRDNDAEQARRDHADRIAALEEAIPREPAATPAGRARSWIQRVGFGIDDPHR